MNLQFNKRFKYFIIRTTNSLRSTCTLLRLSSVRLLEPCVLDRLAAPSSLFTASLFAFPFCVRLCLPLSSSLLPSCLSLRSSARRRRSSPSTPPRTSTQSVRHQPSDRQRARERAQREGQREDTRRAGNTPGRNTCSHRLPRAVAYPVLVISLCAFSLHLFVAVSRFSLLCCWCTLRMTNRHTGTATRTARTIWSERHAHAHWQDRMPRSPCMLVPSQQFL